MLPATARCRFDAGAVTVLLMCAGAAHAQVSGVASGASSDTPSKMPFSAPPMAADQTLDPSSPLAAMPDLGVDWPDLTKPDEPLAEMPAGPNADASVPVATVAPPATATKADVKAAAKAEKADRSTNAAGERRYTIAIKGLEGLKTPDLLDRFNGLSSLKLAQTKPANVAQIDRRAREDAALLTQLLRAYGYYDGEVDTHVDNATGPIIGSEGRLLVTLSVTAGAAYSFTSVSVLGLASTGADTAALVRAFEIHSGDLVNADKVTTGIANLKAALADKGYAFATVSDPDISVDHQSHEARLVLSVDAGRRMRFGAFRVTSTKHVFGPRHIQLLSRLHPGDLYNQALIEDLRRALIQTGLVSVAQITAVRTADPQVVDLNVDVEPAPPRTISASLGYVTGSRITAGQLGYLNTETVSTLGYGTGQGVTAEADWTHRNLFPPEGSLTLRGVLGSQEQLASAIFRRNNFRARDQALVGQITLDHLNVPAFGARTVDLAADVERQTNIIWQKKWTYSYGGELVASDERDVIAATGAPRRRTYFIAAIPLSLAYDGTDDLLNPTRGWRLAAHVSPEVSLQGSAFGYVRMQIDGSAYQPVGEHLVFAGRIRLGSIQGAASDQIAPTRRFYSGGGGSVRGFGYQKIGPRDVANDPIGGASLAEFGMEARIRFGNFGLVPFLDGGNLYSQSLPRFTGLRYGTGLGVRYYTSFGPIRLDVGTPINRQPGDSLVAVYVSLGQAF